MDATKYAWSTVLTQEYMTSIQHLITYVSGLF